MANLPTTLDFQGTEIEVIDLKGQPWLRGHQIGIPLGYDAQPDTAIKKLYARHADEFTPDMTAMVELPTAGGVQQVRIFSPRGCHLLAMLARTPKAKAFRRWVLDVLENLGNNDADLKAEVAALRREVAVLARHLGAPTTFEGQEAHPSLPTEPPRSRPKGARCLTPNQEQEAVILAAKGYSLRQIGKHFGASHTSANRAIKRAQAVGRGR